MEKPVLVVMAAGMGSRYGGLKQIEAVGPHGQVILDYSVFDALRAGFRKIVFVIKEEMHEVFHAKVGARIAPFIELEYCYQKLDDLPQGFTLPAGREKPFGTAHAVLAARGAVKGPFAVINADDYYGPQAFKLIYDYLCGADPAAQPYNFAMVGYTLENTLTENGYVSRGVCEMDGAGRLKSITERVRIEKREDGAAFSEDGGQTFEGIDSKSTVSMNLFGLQRGFMDEAQAQFKAFLQNELPKNELGAEFYLPSVVSSMIAQGKAHLQVLQSEERWYGVTYREDRAEVVSALCAMHERGLYPREMLGLK